MEACLILNEGSTKEKKSVLLFCLQKKKNPWFFRGRFLLILSCLTGLDLKGGRMLSFKDCDAFSVRWVHSCISLMGPTYF